jgi:hypothetical protein
MQHAHARGVLVRAIVHVDEASAPRLAELAAFGELRMKETLRPMAPDVAIALFDGEQAVISHFLPDDASHYNGKDIAILTREEAIVKTFQGLLEHHWASSRPLPPAVLRLREKANGAASTSGPEVAAALADGGRGIVEEYQ